MNYFMILGIVFGLLAFLKPFYMHALPWDENKLLAKVYKKERPLWIVLVAIIGLCLVAYTWYKEVTTDIQYSIILSLIFSLTAAKAILFLADYDRFQTWISNMLSEENSKKIVFIDIITSIFGLAVIILSIMYY